MTVGKLMNILECFDENMEIVMQPSMSKYVDGIDGAVTGELRSFYGANRDVLVLTSSGQEGAV